jgi:hypothetical protein
MENWLRCKLYPGQFEGEFGVDGLQHDGTAFSLFAPKTSIKVDDQPTGDKDTLGWVKVQVLDRRDDLALVKLPRQTFQNGHFVTVKVSELERPLPAPKATAGRRRNCN